MQVINTISRIPLFLLVVVVLSSFKPGSGYQTECVSLDTEGYITIKIWDTQKGAKYSTEDARKDAIRAVFYDGIAGTNGCQSQLPVLGKITEQDNFRAFEKTFFGKKGKWSIFTRSSAPESTLPALLGEKNWKVYQVSVAKANLRKYLEEQKIITSLNNGF